MVGTYKTANGKDFDMGALILKNEKTRAVGNMSVNARGDVVDSTNKTTSNRSAQVNKTYRKQVAKNPPPAPAKKAVEPAPEEIVGLDEPAVTEEVKEPAATGGLAGAISKANKKKK